MHPAHSLRHHAESGLDLVYFGAAASCAEDSCPDCRNLGFIMRDRAENSLGQFLSPGAEDSFACFHFLNGLDEGNRVLIREIG